MNEHAMPGYLWVLYDRSPESLPENGRRIVYVNPSGKSATVGKFFMHNDNPHADRVVIDQYGPVLFAEGAMWIYIPETR